MRSSITLATSRADSPNHIVRWLATVRSYASISFTSLASPFSKALKRKAGIWFVGNPRVEVVAEQGVSIHRESERTYFSERGLPLNPILGNSGARRAKEEGRGSAPSPTEPPGLRDPLYPTRSWSLWLTASARSSMVPVDIKGFTSTFTNPQ